MGPIGYTHRAFLPRHKHETAAIAEIIGYIRYLETYSSDLRKSDNSLWSWISRPISQNFQRIRP